MARHVYENLSTTTEIGISPVWPCTLMIYSGGEGGFLSTADRGLPAQIAVEVRRGNGQYKRFSELTFSQEVVTPLDLPGSMIRIVAENLTNVTVEVIDAEGDS